MSEPSSESPAVRPESLDSEILRSLMQVIPDRIYFKDLQSRFVCVNEAQARWLGAASPAEMVGRNDYDYFAPSHAEAALATEREIIRTGKPSVGLIERLEMKDGSVCWGSATKMPWRDSQGRIIGTFGITRDHTEVKQIEEKLKEERNLLRTIIDLLPSRIFVKDIDGRYVLNNRAHQKSLGVVSQDEATGRTTVDFHPGRRGMQAMADDRSVLSGGPPILARERSDFGREGHVRWALTTKVPLLDVRGKLAGLVGISHDITEQKRVEQELRARTEEMEADVRMARRIQQVFFSQTNPVFPRGVPEEASALRFAHRYVPAATLGGDFFDVIQLSDTQCGVLICDVMGHGVRAGLLTALIRGLVEEMDERAENPAHLLAEINRGFAPILQQTGQPVFASVFFGVIDTVSHRLTYANGGHPPPFLLRTQRGMVEELRAADPEPAAGLVPGFAYTRREVEFGTGDVLFCYTDGLIEAADDHGQMFGEERLRGALVQNVALRGPSLIERMVGAVQAFTGHSEFEDDICAVTVESTGASCTVLAPMWEI